MENTPKVTDYSVPEIRDEKRRIGNEKDVFDDTTPLRGWEKPTKMRGISID